MCPVLGLNPVWVRKIEAPYVGGSESRWELSPASLFGVLGFISLSRVPLPPGKEGISEELAVGDS